MGALLQLGVTIWPMGALLGVWGHWSANGGSSSTEDYWLANGGASSIGAGLPLSQWGRFLVCGVAGQPMGLFLQLGSGLWGGLWGYRVGYGVMGSGYGVCYRIMGRVMGLGCWVMGWVIELWGRLWGGYGIMEWVTAVGYGVMRLWGG